MSVREINGELNAAGKRFAIVQARFNDLFSDRLTGGAIDAILRHGGSEELITVIKVPGSFEIAPVVQQLAQQHSTAAKQQIDAIIAVGCLIKGETDHYDLIASNVASSLSKIMAETGVPCTLGVICCSSMEQAMARSGSKVGNYGWSAATAAIEMIQVMDAVRTAFGNAPSDTQVKTLREVPHR